MFLFINNIFRLYYKICEAQIYHYYFSYILSNGHLKLGLMYKKNLSKTVLLPFNKLKEYKRQFLLKIPSAYNDDIVIIMIFLLEWETFIVIKERVASLKECDEIVVITHRIRGTHWSPFYCHLLMQLNCKSWQLLYKKNSHYSTNAVKRAYNHLQNFNNWYISINIRVYII